MAIYSSGSVRAQELFMAHVGDGQGGVKDMRGVVGGWFDTVNAGPKMENGSYAKISGELKVSQNMWSSWASRLLAVELTWRADFAREVRLLERQC